LAASFKLLGMSRYNDVVHIPRHISSSQPQSPASPVQKLRVIFKTAVHAWKCIHGVGSAHSLELMRPDGKCSVTLCFDWIIQLPVTSSADISYYYRSTVYRTVTRNGHQTHLNSMLTDLWKVIFQTVMWSFIAILAPFDWLSDCGRPPAMLAAGHSVLPLSFKSRLDLSILFFAA